MRLPELRHSLALPVLPRVARRRRHRIGVVLEHGDVVAVAREQKSRAETADSTANDHNRHETSCAAAVDRWDYTTRFVERGEDRGVTLPNCWG